MAGKIKVYGKAQNRTALGIAHAYVVMYPHATIDDLRKAFPNSTCPDSGVKELFLPVEEAMGFNEKMNLYFAKPDEVIKTGDGREVALSQVWSKPSFERMVEAGKANDIEVAEFEKTVGKEKGGYRLEYLNGWVPPAPVETKKKSLTWLWILLGVVVAALLAYLITKPAEKEVQVVEKVVEKEVVVRDTVYVQQIEEIEANFNAAQFEQGKADLNDDAKMALHDLAKLMRQNENLKLSIEGHTSAEGDSLANVELSQKRADAAVAFLVEKEGIAATRLSAIGKGSSEPVSTDSLELNRRTEFKIVEGN